MLQEALVASVSSVVTGEAEAVFGSSMEGTTRHRKGGMPMYKYVGNRSAEVLREWARAVH